MPKASKKAKDKKADFVKAKLKLGKGKKPATNATDTSFKARSVALPSQNPLARALARAEGDAPAEPTTAKGLRLDEVLLHLRHPNAGARREALTGVQDVLQVGVAQGVPLGAREGETAKVVRAVGALVSDNETVVRKAVLAFFSWYIPALPTTALAPYLPLLQLQLSSALSHIFPEIRIDACRLVSLLLEHAPAAIVGAWPHSAAVAGTDGGSTVFEGLRLAVGLGTDGPVAGFGAPAKLVVLRTVLAFVSHALAPLHAEGSARPAAAPVYEWDGVQAGSYRPGWLSRSDTITSDGALQLADLGHGLFQTESDKVDAYLVDLYTSLHPLFVSTFLESAPTAFSPSITAAPSASRDVHVGLCTVAAQLECMLATAILAGSSPSASSSPHSAVRSTVSDFLRRLAAYFPFAPPPAGRAPAPALDPAGVAPAFALSLAYANLAVLLAPRPARPTYAPGSARESAWRRKARAIEAAWAEAARAKASGGDRLALHRVAEWVVDVLTPSADALAPPLPVAAYTALLPIVRALLLVPSVLVGADESIDISSVVGDAFLTHLLRQPGPSPARALGDRFVFALLETHEASHPDEAWLVPRGSALRPLVRRWAEALPKTLWELGNKDEATAEDVMAFLIALPAMSAESPYALVDKSLYQPIAAKLAPYFHLVHPARGAVSGPWARLRAPRPHKLALDLAHTYAAYDAVLPVAVERAVAGDDKAVAYWRARRA
ncbi:rRNA processing protein [Cryptotrichosporon argae]